jgi:hypothetical protein
VEAHRGEHRQRVSDGAAVNSEGSSAVLGDEEMVYGVRLGQAKSKEWSAASTSSWNDDERRTEVSGRRALLPSLLHSIYCGENHGIGLRRCTREREGEITRNQSLLRTESTATARFGRGTGSFPASDSDVPEAT